MLCLLCLTVIKDVEDNSVIYRPILQLIIEGRVSESKNVPNEPYTLSVHECNNLYQGTCIE